MSATACWHVPTFPHPPGPISRVQNCVLDLHYRGTGVRRMHDDDVQRVIASCHVSRLWLPAAQVSLSKINTQLTAMP